MRVIFHIDVNSAYLSWTAVEQLKNGAKVDIRDDTGRSLAATRSPATVSFWQNPFRQKNMAFVQGNLLRMPFVSVQI